MKHDLRKFVPDIAKVLADTTPEKVAERRRKALAQLRDEGLIERITPAPPGADEAEAHEVPRPPPKAPARRRSPLVIGLSAAIAVTVPAILVALFMGREADRKIEAAAESARAAATSAPSMTAPGAPSAPATPSAAAVAPVTPSATAVAPATPSAAATAFPSAAPTAEPSVPARPLRTRGKAQPERSPQVLVPGEVADAGRQEPVVSPDFVQ
jgi:hypothetical protein